MKLGLIIFHICYFIGQIWFIVAKVNMEDWHISRETWSEEQYFEANHDTFIEYYELEDESGVYKSITGLYYAFTTLSTVGFGDLTPRSDVER